LNPVDLPYPYGAPLFGGIIRAEAADFEVVEELGFEPDGEGEHLFLQVEKTALGTMELVERISRDYSIAARHIGFSGLKDKHAVTTQWLSLHLPGDRREFGPQSMDGYRVLRAERHRGKLRRGTHRSNFFRLRVRGVDNLGTESVAQLDAVAGGGMANYFGEQRFGRTGDNVRQALEMLDRGRIGRQRRSLLLSSLRSYLFNQVLAARILEDCWRRPLDGDVFMLRGNRSIFSAALDESILQRFESLDISATASLYGSGRNLLDGEARRFELRILGQYPEIVDCLERQGAKLQMRSLRVAVEDFDYRHDRAGGILTLEARLPAGSYMTSLLAHFMTPAEGPQAVLR
jgi:tRNA pseudouridine13 synthase